MKADLCEIMESIQGEGLLLGSRQIFLRFNGCNLRCSYCDTPSSFHHAKQCKVYLQTGKKDIVEYWENPLTAMQIKEIITGYESSWVSFTGGEPLLWAGFIAELASILKPAGYKCLLETNGTLYEELDKCLPFIDLISMDFKLPSATGQDCWNSHRLFLRKARQKATYIKMVLTDRSTFQELSEAINLIKDIDGAIPLVLQPVTPVKQYTAPEMETLLEMQSLALKSLKEVRILPQIHPFLGLI